MAPYIHARASIARSSSPSGSSTSAEPDGGHGCGGGLPPRALVTITFAGHDGKTTLTINTRFEAAADRDAAVKMGFNMGWASSLDRLADLLEKL
jgi:uncharacterized protein YndB with AHSA1/START domain